MTKYTKKLNLFEYEPEKDGKKTFNITQALNENFDKLDSAVFDKQDKSNLAQTLDTSTTKYPSCNAVKTAIDAKDSLPSQAGNSGKFLNTDGSVAIWKSIDLSSKIDNDDLSELTSIFAPDYSTAVSITLPYTAPYNCVVYFRENDLLNNQTTQVAVDGETVFYKWSSQGYQQPVSALIPLKKGQVLSLTSGSVVDLKSFAYSEEVQYA